MGWLKVYSEFLFCTNSALNFDKMDQLNTNVKFIYILGDMASPQTALVDNLAATMLLSD